MPSKPTEAVLDVNLLIAVVFADHAYLIQLARRHKVTLASLDGRMAGLALPANPAFFFVSGSVP